ncbi:GNAT family N-acetyltransferase [Patescibacteria group bacterium]|nr:GNAT family N-acetyltransferase [Patescibacteria group bacterium]
MEIKKVTKENKIDFENLVDMTHALWSDHTKEELSKEMDKILESNKEDAFVVKENDKYMAFATFSIKHEYVQGADSYPVGYLEGIYVKPNFRKKGLAKKIVEFAEKWALEKGCKQIASDTWLCNEESQKFHKSIGFEEVERIVHFIKKIDMHEKGA